MMTKKTPLGAISAREEFFYPDTKLSKLPGGLRLAMPCNGRPGVQVILETDKAFLQAHLESDSFEAEWFCMHAVPVEYNTGNGEEQGGAMVLSPALTTKPSYATRLAPFEVFDCLEPVEDGKIYSKGHRAAMYFCLIPKKLLAAGVHTAILTMGDYICRIEVKVYGAIAPEKNFSVTNWFSLEAIARFHCLKERTDAFYEMVGKYAKLMRRMHQTMFFISLDNQCVVRRAPYEFDFTYLEPLIECFLGAGLDTLEIGPVLSRGYLPNGNPDMHTNCFTCAMAPQVRIDTPEGYEITVRYIKALSVFLKKHGWDKKLVFHIHDEPDIHCPAQALEPRKKQYYLAASILRKYLPGVKVIEAVSTAEFRGGIDIWVPGTAGYEQNKAAFDQLIVLGEEVWNYVCCGPEGKWLNRFLDFALLKGRLLFWGCARNRLTGFLHWGFNQFPHGMNPFKGTSCPNDTGLGTNFPCGDSFIVYPGKGAPWPSMRLEAARRGAEDAALLKLLREKNEEAHDELIAEVFHSNSNYNDDPQVFERTYEKLLHLLDGAL